MEDSNYHVGIELTSLTSKLFSFLNYGMRQQCCSDLPSLCYLYLMNLQGLLIKVVFDYLNLES